MRCCESKGLSTWTVALTCLLAGCAGDSQETSVSKGCAIELGNAPVRGAEDGWVTIVEFADFQCGFCQREQATLLEVDDARPGLRWAFKYFPITELHANAELAASAADCANEQGEFWAMHDRLFVEAGVSMTAASLRTYAEELSLDLTAWDDCFESDESLARVAADRQLGLEVGVGGTPTFFINDYVLPGAYPTADFLNNIDLAKEEAESSGLQPSEYYQTLVERGCSE